MATSEPGKPASPAKAGSGAEDTVPASSGPGDGWPVAADPDGEPRASGRIDRYVFGPELGRGGMGRVVEATDSRLGRKVAVKEALPRGIDLRRRFEREVRITARLEHPSIVPLYDAGLTGAGNPFYVMRKVSGRPLDKLIADARDLGERLILLPHLLAAIDAIAHAHRRDIVHRDMKPANILVGEHGETVVIDWGLAKALGEEDDDPIDPALAPSDAVETQIGAVFGTPGFMAPEQARGDTLDARSDVYALGATLYQLLSGRPPHSGTTATEVIDRALVERPPALPDLVPGVPPELVTITDKALAYQPDGRYGDAGALAEDVRRFLAGQLVAAHRYTTRQRLGRFLRRHRTAVAVATLATIALVVGGALSINGIVTERDRAKRAEARAMREKADAEAARDREADRADELLITQAEALVSVNPTAAIAALKLVRPTSPRLRNARVVAQSAAARGAAWGYPGHGIATASLALAPDGHRLLSSGQLHGLRIHDLDTREELLHVDFPDRVESTWVSGGDAVLAAPEDGGLILFDARTGARTPIPWVDGLRADVMEPTEAGDRVFVSDHLHALHVVDVAARTVAPLGLDQADTLAVAPDGSWFIAGGRTSLRVVRTSDVKVLAQLDDQTSWVVIAPDGKRGGAIAGTRPVVISMDGQRATITPLGPVPSRDRDARYPAQVLFRGDDLLVSRISGPVEMLGADGKLHTLIQPRNPLMMGAVARGGVVAFGDHRGSLVLGGRGDLREIRAPAEVQLKRIAARPDSRYVAVAAEGLILVWDLDRAGPSLLSIPETQGLVFRDDNTMLLTPRFGPWELLDLRSGTSTKVDHGAEMTAIRRILVDDDDGRILVDLFGRGVVQLLPGASRVEQIADGEITALAFLSGNRFAYGTEDGQVVFGSGRADRRVVMVAQARIDVIDRAGDGAIVLTGDDVVLRFDGGGREIGRIALPEPASGPIVLDPTGRVLIGIANRLVVWNGARLDDVAELGAPVRGLAVTGGVILVLTREGDTYAIGPDHRPRRLLAQTQMEIQLARSAGVLLSALADGQLVFVDVASGERGVLPTGGLRRLAVISPDARRVAYYEGTKLALWNLDAPQIDEPDAWRPWLDQLTNAQPSTSVDVVWPWQLP